MEYWFVLQRFRDLACLFSGTGGSRTHDGFLVVSLKGCCTRPLCDGPVCFSILLCYHTSSPGQDQFYVKTKGAASNQNETKLGNLWQLKSLAALAWSVEFPPEPDYATTYHTPGNQASSPRTPATFQKKRRSFPGNGDATLPTR